MSRARLLIADDHAILLDAFKRLLEPEYDVVGVVTEGRALLQAAEVLKPDVILTDISMPGLNGLDAAEHLRARLPGVKVIFLTVCEDPEVAAEAIRRGAAGYVLKKSASSELFEGLREVLAGRRYVTPVLAQPSTSVFVTAAERSSRAVPELSLRQREVLQLLAEGRSMKEAADILGVTPRAIAFHKYGMIEQLGLRNGAELIQYAVARRIVSPRG
ncbi:MAG: response regulator transcription factor [Verrucomicrobiae bacterium]|nr:response regulator transcription factor [Verrucomicrobiae bacterium]